MGNYVPISLNEALQAMPNTCIFHIDLKSTAELYQRAIVYTYVLNYGLNCDIAETLNAQIFWCMPMDL